MAADLIHDRGQLVGTRINVYNLMPYFIDATATEEYICRMTGLSPEQVAAARAYVFEHADDVLAQHLKIEERIAQGNPPEVIEHARESKARLERFKRWFDDYQAAKKAWSTGSPQLPSFRDWLAAQQPQSQAQP